MNHGKKRSRKPLEWSVTVTPHQKPEYRWARMSPSFEKGWITLTPHTLKAKVKENATGNEIRAAVQQRLERAGHATNVPIKIQA